MLETFFIVLIAVVGITTAWFAGYVVYRLLKDNR